MSSGGDRGGRRPKGSLGKRTKALLAIKDQALHAGITPLEVLLNNMRFYYDKISKAEQMLEAAIAQHEPTEKIIQVLKTLCDFRSEAGRFAVEAAPYCHSRMATLTVSGDPNNPLEMVHSIADDMTPQQAQETYAGTLRTDNVTPITKRMAA